MRDEMKKHGIDCGGYAPVWAFHSCGQFEKPPTLGEARSLLSDLEIDAGVKTIELNCPDEFVLLTKYHAWNDILDHFIMNELEKISVKEIRELHDLIPENLDEYDSIQATLPFLKKNWVVDIRELKLKTGDYDFDEKGFV